MLLQSKHNQPTLETSLTNYAFLVINQKLTQPIFSVQQFQKFIRPERAPKLI